MLTSGGPAKRSWSRYSQGKVVVLSGGQPAFFHSSVRSLSKSSLLLNLPFPQAPFQPVYLFVMRGHQVLPRNGPATTQFVRKALQGLEAKRKERG
jgi:hypothetical protein